MSKTITFLIDTSDGPMPEEGRVCWFNVGGKRRKFVIHGNTLTDYRSGRRVTDFGGVSIERMARISTCTKTTPREAAAIALGRILANIGVRRFMEVVNAAPALNK